MTRKISLLAMLALALAAGCTDGARDSKVFQGVCLAMSDGGQTLKLTNHQPKLNLIKTPEASFDIAKAKVGLTPEPGNVIRVSYLEKGDRLVALKVMNITKQDLRKK